MAEYRMKEAIKFHLEGLKEGEIAIPEPSTKAVSIEVTAQLIYQDKIIFHHSTRWCILSKNPFRLDKGYEVFGTYKRFLSAKIKIVLVIKMGIRVKAKYEKCFEAFGVAGFGGGIE